MEEKCMYCKGNLYGKKEKKSYGLYCKTCGKWIYKNEELLKEEEMEVDKEEYKIILIGEGNEKQMEQIAQMAGINIYMAGEYLRTEKEVVLYKGNAKETYENARNITEKGLLYKIEPEYPYEILRKMTEEEKEKITKKILEKIKIFS